MQPSFALAARTMLAAAALTTLAAPALAQSSTATTEPRVYMGLQLGRHNLDSWDNQVRLGPGVALDGKVHTDAGNVFGVVLGRQSENARYELEYQRGAFDVRRIELGAVNQPVSGSGKYQALTLNAYRQEAFNAQWSGYAGVGLGWGKADVPRIDLSNGCNCVGEAAKSGLTLLARAGVEYRFDQHHNAFAQYTLLRVPGPSAGGTPGVSYDKQWIGALAVGYRYLF